MKFSITRCLVIGFLSFSSLAWAETAHDLLQADLQKGVKSLPRETNFYNYFGINTGAHQIEDTTLKDYQGRQVYVNQRLALGGKAFRDFNNHTGGMINAGPGLYLAVDPFASSPGAVKDSGGYFGDSMMELKMRPGTKYLSVFAPIAISKSTMSALISEGYLTNESAKRVMAGGRFSRDTLKFMIGLGFDNFRKLVADMMIEMNINIIEYAWQSGTSSLCGWKDLRSAFVYIATEVPSDVSDVNLVYLKGFSNKVILSSAEEDALQRNQTLIPLLAKLRVLEKQMKGAKDVASRKYIRQEVVNEIDSTLSPEALRQLKDQTFKCL